MYALIKPNIKINHLLNFHILCKCLHSANHIFIECLIFRRIKFIKVRYFLKLRQHSFRNSHVIKTQINLC